jgi:hypothetical protein
MNPTQAEDDHSASVAWLALQNAGELPVTCYVKLDYPQQHRQQSLEKGLGQY